MLTSGSLAIAAYTEAAKLSPLDPSPLSNLSAASFEAGNYAEGIKFADKALVLLEEKPEDDLKRQKLILRSAKAHVFLSDTAPAEDASNLLSPGPDRELLHGAVANLKAFQSHRLDSRSLKGQLLHLPRYRPQM